MKRASDKKIGRKLSWISSVRVDKSKNEDDIKKIFVDKTPFSRRDHTLCYDENTQKLYLYGGIFLKTIFYEKKAGTLSIGPLTNLSLWKFGPLTQVIYS